MDIRDVEDLENRLSEPTEGVVEVLSQLEGDLLILGVAGKMGPTLARMAKRAGDAAGVERSIIGVSRFTHREDEAKLRSHGIETIRGDLLDERTLDELPDAANIIYMAGMKFGAVKNEPLTWAMNTHLPAMVCRRFPARRIVAFSTGNVYGMVPFASGGSVETDKPKPDGEYAMSCLGRERMFQHFSQMLHTPVTLLRLNYAVEMRYGVLVDLAQQVRAEQEIDLSMGYANVVWQGDANAIALQALRHTASPPFILNVSGPELVSVRQACRQLADNMGKSVHFVGQESEDAFLSNGKLGHELFGRPRVDLDTLLAWTADWVMKGGESINRPTHFEVRDGGF